MSDYYFAYGSNMNAERMRLRGLRFQRALSGHIENLALAFNKRAADAPHRAYANVIYRPGERLEGVLYQLDSVEEIIKMDPFEGAPRFYSREIYQVQTISGPISAWMYVANRAMLSEGLAPERWYLEHLLAGQSYLTEPYFERLSRVVCVDDECLDSDKPGEPR